MLLLLKSEDSLRLVDQLNSNFSGLRSSKSESSYCVKKKQIEDSKKMALNSSRRVEDYDAFQPCFFEDKGAELEEDFYDTPVTSEDIWKKFELLPTPPTSPKHEPLYQTLGSDMDKMVSDILDHNLDDYLTETSVLVDFTNSGNLSPTSTTEESESESCSDCAQTQSCLRCIPIQSKLIQDCMWSGLNLPKEIKDSLKYISRSNSCSSTSSDNSVDSRTSLSDSGDNINASTDCVDPTAVFPFPVNDKPRLAPSSGAISLLNTSSSSVNTFNLDLQDNLGVESPSDSDESSDEEIDVVTVASDKISQQQTQQREQQQQRVVLMQRGVTSRAPSSVSMLQQTRSPSILQRKRTLPSPTHVSSQLQESLLSTNTAATHSSVTMSAQSSMSAQVAAMHNYTAAPSSEPPQPATPSPSKRSRQSTTHHPSTQHNDHSHSGPPMKRIRVTAPAGTTDSDLRSVVRKLHHHKHGGHTSSSAHGKNSSKHSSRNSSDSEDSEGRRAQHNVLERKRRNDLKSSFMTLKDKIPELQTQERAPKVMILNKATDYVYTLQTREQQLISELEYQQRTNERLLRKLRQLEMQS